MTSSSINEEDKEKKAAGVERYSFTSFGGSQAAGNLPEAAAPPVAQGNSKPGALQTLAGFIRPFDAPSGEFKTSHPANQPKAEPTFSVKDLEKAKEASFKEGYEQGMKTGLEQGQGERLKTDQKITMLLADIEARIKESLTSVDQLMAEKTNEIAQIITMIARKISGDALRDDPTAKIIPIIKDCLASLINQEAINIFVNEVVLSEIKEKISAYKENLGFKGQLNFKADSELSATSARVEWQNGEALLDIDKLWQEVDSRLKNML